MAEDDSIPQGGGCRWHVAAVAVDTGRGCALRSPGGPFEGSIDWKYPQHRWPKNGSMDTKALGTGSRPGDLAEPEIHVPEGAPRLTGADSPYHPTVPPSTGPPAPPAPSLISQTWRA